MSDHEPADIQPEQELEQEQEKASPDMKPRYSKLTAAQIEEKLAAERRQHLNATWSQLGRINGWSGRQTRRYASGEYDGRLPLAIDLTLRLALYEPQIWRQGTSKWHETRLPKLLKRRNEMQMQSDRNR